MNENNNYQKQLLNIISSPNIKNKELEDILKFNVYLSLLSLNNHNYSNDFFYHEHNIIDDFLRKINNLKVKIQLKRKTQEIDKLIQEIASLYNDNLKVIEKYNKQDIDILNTINTKNPQKITKLIDTLTKLKIQKCEKKDDYAQKRDYIDTFIFDSNYYLKEDKLYLINKEREESVPLEEFYDIFDYLLDIENYKQVFLNNQINREHIVIIGELINLAQSKEILNEICEKQLIPILLTSLITTRIKDLSTIDTSNFKISNIKIADLYLFASQNITNDNSKTAKWNKVIIPNQYLYQKLIELIKKGMYYYQGENFTLENIDNKISDFKISISISQAMELLKEIINNHLESFSS